MRILVACEESQAVTKEFRALGHEAYSCDIVECSGGFPEWHIMQDVIPLLNGCCEFTTVDGVTHTGDYTPDNCRFITMSAQQRNRSSCKNITYNGETHNVQEWAELLGITASTLRSRFNKGWSIERALTESVRSGGYV